jgi:F-type H+-transporting ATPase subunit epsilon
MLIHVDVITPEKLAFSEEVDFVAAPAIDGEIGILPGHIPLLTRLGAGEVRLKKNDTVHYIAITGGFLEVQHGSHVSIFAETAEIADEIDEERARLAAERAKTKLVTSKDLTPEELAQVEASLSRALLRLKMVDVRRRKAPRGEPIH